MAVANDVSAVIDLLQHLTVEELKEVLNNNDKFEDMTRSNGININAKAEKDLLMASNKSLAEYNLCKSAELSDKKDSLLELYEQLKEINRNVGDQLNKLKSLSKNSNAEHIMSLLQVATSEIECETDNISEKLLSKEMSIDLFRDEYPIKRKLMYLRKTKLEKMSEMISRRQSYQNNASVRSPISQNNINNNGYIYGNVPYPAEPTIPMPGQIVYPY